MGTQGSHKKKRAAPDERFAAASYDPRFGRVPKRAKSGAIDERFEKALRTNPGFRPVRTPVDRFGRAKGAPVLERGLKELAAESESESEEEVGFGGGELDTSEEESGLESDSEGEVVILGRATKRLAVLGLDWSNTRAVDIFASLNSFCPPGKVVSWVKVHPSKFGLERLAVEAKLGPQVVSETDLKVVADAVDRAVSGGGGKDGGHSSDDEGADSDRDASAGDDNDDIDARLWKEQAALRKYEEERLKYYYAVAEFDDVKSADAVYEQCDGVEYAQSGRAFDLRFIPDDMKIETVPRDTATSIPEGYAPPNIVPSSLNNSRVKLSWDADDPDRVILKKKAIGKHTLDEENLKAYLASASEDESDKPTAEEIARTRRLLLGGDSGDGSDGGGDAQSDEDLDMQVTFEPGMLEKGEEIIKRKQEREQQKDESAWEARLRRREERKAEKRRKRRESFAEVDGGEENYAESDGENAVDGAADGFVENPVFNEDPFFTSVPDGEKKEASESKKAKKANAKTRRDDEDSAVKEDDEVEKARKRSEAELELLVMDEHVSKGRSSSLREALAAAESDDDEDRETRRKDKKTRGRRRKDKERRLEAKIGKPSAMDTSDARFSGLFDSHLFAIDPTHPKYKENETTAKILKEKAQRANARGLAVFQPPVEQERPSNPTAKHSATATKITTGLDGDVMQLAARIKARASAKRSSKKSPS